jgi:DNA-directed RNA polymerase subunit L
MLAHRLTLLPLGVVDIDRFDPTEYECVLQVKNETPDLMHVTASAFRVMRKTGEDGAMEPLGDAETNAMFPRDPITNDSCLLITLRQQWSSKQPAEELDLTAYPVIGRGRDFMGFCPVSQCSFANTPDDNLTRRTEFFNEWATAYKQIPDPASLTPEEKEPLEAEWETMAVQRCFKVGPDGQPNSFTFTVESVGIRPVKDIVAEGIRAIIDLVTPFTKKELTMEELGMSTEAVDSRMNGINILFQNQDHTLGNLLQTIITERHLSNEGAATAPITFAGYKIRHPLHRVMTLTLGIREGETRDRAAIAREYIEDAAMAALTLFESMARSWADETGTGVARGEAARQATAFREAEG